MSRMTNPANSLCFSTKLRVVPTPPVFSGKMRLAFNVTVNLHDTPAGPTRFRIFFQGKRVSQQPFQTPHVFTSKTRLGFNVIVNLHVMRSTASTFLVFYHRNTPRRNPAAFLGFTFLAISQSKLWVQRGDCEFTCDAANRSRIRNFFPRKTRPSRGIPRARCHCKCSFVPKPGRRPNVDKEAL